MSVLEVKNVSYIYGPKTPFRKVAVDDVSFSIEEGECVGLIGHTGSGKSTLIQQLNGLLRPTSGTVLLHGKDIWEQPKKIRSVRFQVGMVFQYPEYQLFEETVFKDIAFGPKNQKLSEPEIGERVMAAADFVGMDRNLLEKSPFELSGGEKRRAAIAGVIAMDPDVLILDEPTAGLDPMGRDMILGQIMEYHKKRRNTIVLVSHSMEDIAETADRILVMNQGKVAMFDQPAQVFAQGQELQAMGLQVPQVTRIMTMLREKGYPVPSGVFTLRQAVEALLPLLQKKGEGASHG
ncbi:MAG: energy-coupling factor transporter ATPase [Clostridiales bacterium]|jgi:energy-coupling factor transport system ATP-binding protein|nr:energy-coupling factor transporter ATPase [Clostridiales bacterium]